MLQTYYIPHNGDLYEVTIDILGEIERATVYRENNHSAGELVKDLELLPPKVIAKVKQKNMNWFKNI
jgi:hypothetical protein